MRVNKTPPFLPFGCQPIRNFKGTACQPLRERSVTERNLPITNNAIDVSNMASIKHNYDIIFSALLGCLVGMFGATIVKNSKGV